MSHDITPEYTDDKGVYKKCYVCKKKIYLEDYKKTRYKKKGRYTTKNFIKSNWDRFKYCSTGCSNKRKNLTKVVKQKVCKNCGRVYKKGEESTTHWLNRAYCSESCRQEHYIFRRMATIMGIDIEILKKELVKVAEKYAKNGGLNES